MNCSKETEAAPFGIFIVGKPHHQSSHPEGEG